MVYHEEEEEDRCSSNESASLRASKTGFDLDDELLEETEDEDEEEDDDDDDGDDDEVIDQPESLRKSLPPSPPRRSAPGRSTSMCPSMFSRSAPARTSSSERMAELLGLPPRGGSRDSQPPAPQRRAPARSYSARISATSSNARQPPSRQRSGDQLAQMLQMRPALSSTGSGSGSAGGDDDDELAPVNRLACLQRQTSRRMMMDVAPSRPSRRVLAADPSEDSGDDIDSHLLDAAAAAPPMFSRRPPARSTSISRPVA